MENCCTFIPSEACCRVLGLPDTGEQSGGFQFMFCNQTDNRGS